ncbi:MAG: hypothetical protein R3F36_00785 [Candidatus Competibacteraceae bacterium]
MTIEIQAPRRADDFLHALRQPPPLARIDTLDISELTPHQLEPAFVIAASGAGAVSADITPDTAVCEDCLVELFDPGDRRYRHPFVNCTNCGPCYTITAVSP